MLREAAFQTNSRRVVEKLEPLEELGCFYWRLEVFQQAWQWRSYVQHQIVPAIGAGAGAGAGAVHGRHSADYAESEEHPRRAPRGYSEAVRLP